MLQEVLQALDPKPGEIVCDCTLGGAGHSIELGKRIIPGGISLGIDQDQMALKAAKERFSQKLPDAHFMPLHGNFGNLDSLLEEAEVPGVDAFLFDLGVSSPQLDVPERGFSFHEDAPLDMRMDPQSNALTAREVINTYTQADLIRILRRYADEKFAPQIAHAIVKTRAKAPINTTLELVEVIKGAVPAAAKRAGHPARKTFQAVRIEVNHELEVLERGLTQAIAWANPGARICVIAYHSLEDKLVKHIFSEYSQGCICPPDLPVCACGRVPILKVVTRKALVATQEEISANPRARSALMRVAIKLDTTQEPLAVELDHKSSSMLD